MEIQNLLERVVWTGLVVTGTIARVTGVLLEWLFVVAAWIALLLIGAMMAFRRGVLPWADPTDARATSRSAGSTVRRAPLR